MPFNEFKPTGVTAASKPDAGGGNAKTVPVLGIVKSNIDPIRQGRLQVYIVDPSSSTDPNDSEAWVTVSYMSPFYGRTTPSSNNDGYGKYKNNPSSYGEWHSPPDIGSTVVCIFINGDMNYGYYIGCVPEPEALTMVPAIGATDNIVPNEGEAQSYGGALRLPVTNINTNNENMADGPNYLREPKPIHSYSAAIMTQQGLIRDPIRGPISTSSQRETPSRVGWGVSTPGRPIYEGGFDDTNVVDNLTPEKASQLKVIGRRGGHSFVMDDGDLIGRDQLVRIRSALGHQILMSDDGQTLFIIHSNGQSYIELGKEGTVDIFSTNSINLRTQGDLNLHADNNININATKNLNIQAENINVNSDKEYNQKVGTNFKSFTVGQYLNKVSKQMSFASGADASFSSNAITYINGSKINLNTGETSAIPPEVQAIPLVAHTDTLYDKIKGWAAAPGKLLSITSRAPAHAPWANAGQGVDVKVSGDSDAALPSSPAPDLSSVNQAAATATTSAPNLATTATMPVTSAVSKAIDKNATNSVLGAISTQAATGPLAQAVTSGAAVIQSGTSKIAAVGSFAQTPAMLEASGVLKPGAATLVNSLVAGGANVQSALTNNLFSGKPGAESLSSFVQSTASQAASVVQNMTNVQTALTNVGAISGTESSTQIAGMVMSGLTNGIGPTLNAVKDLGGTAGSAISAAASAIASPAAALASGLTGSASALLGNTTGLTNAAGNALKTIGAGNFAANISETVTGALGGISTAVGSLSKIEGLAGAIDASRGAAAAAFSAITNSFKPLQAGVPQNLSQIAASAAAVAAGASGQLGQTSTSLVNAAGGVLSGGGGFISGAVSAASSLIPAGSGVLTSALSTVAGASNSPAGLIPNSLSAAGSVINNAVSSATSSVTAGLGSLAGASTILNSATSSLGSLSGAATGVVGGLASAASTIASGISALPGGQATIATVLNNAPGAINSLPGAAALGGLVANVSSALQNGLPNPGGLLAQAGSLSSLLSAGLPAGAASQLTSAISALSSGSSVSIQMPTVALNTFDRAGLTSQIGSVLGDKGIPIPNFLGEIPSSAKTGYQATIDKSKEISTAVEVYEKELAKVKAARIAYQEAKNNLPAGDPQIETLKTAWITSIESPSYVAAKKKIDELTG